MNYANDDIPVQICINGPLLGYQRSNDDVIVIPMYKVFKCTYVSFYNLLLELYRNIGYGPECSSSQDASIDMQHDLFRSIRDLDLG